MHFKRDGSLSLTRQDSRVTGISFVHALKFINNCLLLSRKIAYFFAQRQMAEATDSSLKQMIAEYISILIHRFILLRN